MHRRFIKLSGTKLDKHEFWRAVSRVAKLSRKPKPLFEKPPVGELDSEIVGWLSRYNPWWRAQPSASTERFRRWAFAEVMGRLKSHLAKVVVIRGSRRVGKSVIQQQLVEQLLFLSDVNPARILYAQFDEIPKLGTMSMPVLAIVDWYEQNVLKKTLNASAKAGEPAYLLFDEIQNLADWSVQLKSLVDHTDVNTVVTGSSAMPLGEGQDNLAGRMTTIELGPLRLSEIAGIRRLGELPPYASDAPLEEWKNKDFWLGLVAHGKKHAKLRTQAFRLYSEFGGYPLCHNTSETDSAKLRQQVIDEVITKTIEFDPPHRSRAQSLDAQFVREMFRLTCRYSGQAPKPRLLADEARAVLQTGVTEAKVNEAVSFLTDSLLLTAIPPLEMLAKKQSHPPKLCVCDHFVRDGILQETLPLDVGALKDCNEAVATQVGHVIESVLGYYLRGMPGLEVAWFPERATEPEVDFVLTVGTRRIPIEVKYRRSAPSSADTVGLAAFCAKAAYGADFGIVVTQTAEGDLGNNLIAVPASTFLLLR